MFRQRITMLQEGVWSLHQSIPSTCLTLNKMSPAQRDCWRTPVFLFPPCWLGFSFHFFYCQNLAFEFLWGAGAPKTCQSQEIWILVISFCFWLLLCIEGLEMLNSTDTKLNFLAARREVQPLIRSCSPTTSRYESIHFLCYINILNFSCMFNP